MKIHTVNEHETLYEIARLYGTHPTKIAENNGLTDTERLTVGQKLLILPPTRTYTTKSGDTTERIAARFGVDEKRLYKFNPCLWGERRLKENRILALCYDAPTVSDLAVNGYYYCGCTETRLREILPYLNYLTVSAAVADGERIRRSCDGKAALREAKAQGVKCIFRICDGAPYERIWERGEEYAEGVCELARSLGYDGLTIGYARASEHPEYESLVERYKRAAERRGLFLFAEVDGNRHYTASHSADGYIFSYEKLGENPIPSFEDGEKRAINEYAERQESTYGFLELPSLAHTDGGEIDYALAAREGARAQKKIEYDEAAMVCRYKRKTKSGEQSVVFASLENVKARLELCSELGFRGVSIDIMRVPTALIMLLATSAVSPRCNPLP